MQITTNASFNLQQPDYSVIYEPQGNQLSRFVLVKLMDGSAPWVVPAGTLAVIRYKKPDGTFGVYDSNEKGNSAYSISGSTITIELVSQMLTVAGNVAAQIDFYNADGQHLSTFSFRVAVEESPITDGEIESSDYFNLLTARIAEAAQIWEEIRSAYGAPRTAASAAGMTDHDLIYVYVGTTTSSLTNGHWYYWNGSAWTDGGVYNSTAFQTDATLTIPGAAADAAAAGNIVVYATGNREISYTDNYKIANASGTVDITALLADELFKCAVVSCAPGDQFVIWGGAPSNYRLYSFSDASGNILENAGQYAVAYELLITAPDDSAYLVINSRKDYTDVIKAYRGVSCIQLTKEASGKNSELDITKNNYSARTLSGPVVCIKNAAKKPLAHFEIPLTASQSGSGTPAPDNPRRIVTPAAVTAFVSAGIDESTARAYAADLTRAGVEFGHAVYDAALGKLTVDYGIFTVTSTTPLSVSSGQNRAFFALPTKRDGAGLDDPLCLCDICEKGPTANPVPTTAGFKISIGIASMPKIIYLNGYKNLDGVTNETTFRAWLAQHPITFTYPLEVPRVYYLDHEEIIPENDVNYLWTSQHDAEISNTIEYLPAESHMYDAPGGKMEYCYYNGEGVKTTTYTKLSPSQIMHTFLPTRANIQLGYKSGYHSYLSVFDDSGAYVSEKSVSNETGDLYIPANTNYYITLRKYDNSAFDHPTSGASAETVFSYQLQMCKLYNEAVTIQTGEWVAICQQKLQELPSTLSVFRRIGCCGDSFTQGSIHDADTPATSYVRRQQSWGAIIGRQLGVDIGIFAKGGKTVAEWLTVAEGLPALSADVTENGPRDLYILAFGINDRNAIGTNYPLGSAADCDPQSANYGVTFYGCYAKAVDSILALAPDAKIVCLSIFRRAERELDGEIATIAETLGLPFIRISDDVYFISDVYRRGLWGDGLHPTAVAYGGMANAINRLISREMAENVRGYWLNYYGEAT